MPKIFDLYLLSIFFLVPEIQGKVRFFLLKGAKIREGAG
jgi:hypothetical protein